MFLRESYGRGSGLHFDRTGAKSDGSAARVARFREDHSVIRPFLADMRAGATCVNRSGLLAACSLGQSGPKAQPDAAALVEDSIANHERDWREWAQWRYRQVDGTYTGGQKHEEVSEVIPLYRHALRTAGRQRRTRTYRRTSRSKEDQKYEKASERRRRNRPRNGPHGCRKARIRNGPSSKDIPAGLRLRNARGRGCGWARRMDRCR